MYRCDTKSMEDKIKTFSKFGDAGHGGITRYALSEEDKMARAEWLRRMEAIGATIEQFGKETLSSMPRSPAPSPA